MSKIDDLIQQFCPNGVKYIELGKVLQPKENIKWKSHIDSTFLYIDLSSVDRVTHRISDTPEINAASAPSRAQQIVREGDVIFGTTRPTLKRFSVIVKEFDGQIASTGFCVLRPSGSILTNYLFHLIGSSDFNDYVEANQKGASYPAISDAEVKKFKIPIPPIEVQREIVNILDKFTQLEAELEAELEARKKQYEYYRNQLLTFDDAGGVRWTTLGEIGKVSMCKRIFKDQTVPTGDIPFYKIGTFGKSPDSYISEMLYNEYRSKYSFPKKGDILLSASGTIGRTVVYDGKPAYFQDSNIIWLDNDEKTVTNKYLYHVYKIVKWQTEGGTIQRLYNDNLKKIKIQVPPIAEQNRIVAILDKFDKLVNDISEGLPAELKARRKQYEYYRNKLLTFEELPA